MDHHFTGFLQLCNDAIQAVPAFPNAEVSFNLAPLAGFPLFQFPLLFLDYLIRVGLTEVGTVQMDSVLFAILHVLT